MTYSSSLRFLYSLERFGIKLGLRNIRSLLSTVGNPERQFPSIHIAGTNGKGSTSAMIASIFQQAGYKVGLYSSPHLVDFRERIRVNGRAIDRRKLTHLTRFLKPTIVELKCTFFEATTAIAFLHFEEEKVDIAVVETGLGGRLDATNVLRPLASVITNIGLEHTEHLGNSLAKIAAEKAGIIKRGVPCIVGKLRPEALRVIEEVAASRQAKIINAERITRFNIEKVGLNRVTLTLKTLLREYKSLRLDLTGRFQAENACLAVLVAETVADQSANFALAAGDIRRGLKNVRVNTGLSGRLQVIRKRPRIILDVAHNPDSIERLGEALRDLPLSHTIAIFGVMKDKDAVKMVAGLRQFVDELIAVQPKTDRALKARGIVALADEAGLAASLGGSVEEGLKRALQDVRPSDTILITGSHYVVGEALKFLRGR